MTQPLATMDLVLPGHSQRSLQSRVEDKSRAVAAESPVALALRSHRWCAGEAQTLSHPWQGKRKSIPIPQWVF